MRDDINKQWNAERVSALCRELYEEYLAVGISTQPADFDRAEAAISRLYEKQGRLAPEFLRFASPRAAAALFADQLADQLRGQLRGQLWGQLRGQLWGQLGDQLRGQLWGQLGDQLGDQLADQLGDQLRGQLRGQLWGQLWGQLRDQLRGQLWGQLGDQLRGQLWGQLGGQLGGQQDADDIALCRACLQILGGDATIDREALDLFEDVSRSIMWWWPREKVCVLCDRPEALAFDDAGRLHGDGGPAVRFRDGWALHFLSGVAVEPWMAEKPADDIDTVDIMGVENAEQRMALLQRCGVERLWSEAAIVDAEAGYALGDLDLGDGQAGRFLRMTNPSTGSVHVEGVPNDTLTCLDALWWRMPEFAQRCKRDSAGEPWHLHGDVFICPAGAESLQPWPSQIDGQIFEELRRGSKQEA